MRRDKTGPNRRFITALQCLQDMRAEMRMAEDSRRGFAPEEVGSGTFQQMCPIATPSKAGKTIRPQGEEDFAEHRAISDKTLI